MITLFSKSNKQLKWLSPITQSLMSHIIRFVWFNKVGQLNKTKTHFQHLLEYITNIIWQHLGTLSSLWRIYIRNRILWHWPCHVIPKGGGGLLIDIYPAPFCDITPMISILYMTLFRSSENTVYMSESYSDHCLQVNIVVLLPCKHV